MKVRSLFFVALLALAGVACSSKATPSSNSTTTPPPAAGNVVAVVGNTFQPKDLTVAAGTTVTWGWAGSVPHNVVADNGEWKSGDAVNTGTFSQKFDVSGSSEKYYCAVHGGKGGIGMAGTITVS